jgi:hypothetical protein
MKVCVVNIPNSNVQFHMKSPFSHYCIRSKKSANQCHGTATCQDEVAMNFLFVILNFDMGNFVS